MQNGHHGWSIKVRVVGSDRPYVFMVLPPSVTGPGAIQDRQAVGVLVVHCTPGHPDDPANLTIASISIRDANTGAGIIITQDGSVRWVI